MKTFTLRLAALLAMPLLIVGVAMAQTAQPVNATDFNKWTAFMLTPITATGSASFTVAPGYVSGTRGEQPIPVLETNGYVTVDTGAAAETVQVTSVTCTGGPNSQCTGTATFSNTHPGSRTPIASGTGGVQEAYAFETRLGGGQIVLGPDFGSSNTPIGYVQGSTSVGLEDFRSGSPSFWTWSGSAYVNNIAPSYTDCGTSASCASPTVSSGALIVVGHTAVSSSTTLALTGLPFKVATSYACAFSDPSHAYTWTTVNSSGSATTATFGTSNSDTWTWSCVGH